jgi:selenide,water dikinase
LSADALAQVLRPVNDIFSSKDFPDLLVGIQDPDDAAVWKLDDQRALVVTTDFFTPVVDDPYDYGSIAAANSISDVYAMGATPFLALNIAGIPQSLPAWVGGEIMRGGAEKALEAGIVLAGGHTIQDDEPKYGLIVLGFVDTEKMMTKGGARAGDRLVLSKPLGFGATTTALKQQRADPADVAEVVGWMKQLSNKAAQLGIEFGVRGATDVTGFSLLGHGMEMAEASGVKFRIRFDAIPFVSCAQKYAQEWTFPGGASDNRLYFGPRVTFTTGLEEHNQMLLFDPQTSGGLLMSVPPDVLERFLARAEELGQPVWEIGEVIEGDGIEIV